ncbi:MAG: phosphatase PAP2 family protein [Neisseria sp.]|nr:phosphatase PAP2 family protein [Neisseria sp.]
MTQTLSDWNTSLFLLINAQAGSPPLMLDMAEFAAESLVVVMFSCLACYLLHHRRDRKVWLGVFCCIAAAMLATYLIRKGFHHPRPFMLGIGTNFLEHAPSSSFPSKHATPVFAAGTYLALLPPTRLFGLAWLLLAAAVAWSRIYLGVHWPLDMAGALLVSLTAALACKYLLAQAKPGT